MHAPAAPSREDTTTAAPAPMPYEFLSNEHPVYKANKETWERNERRLAGGDEVLEELARFEWEADEPGRPNANYLDRKKRAAYVNFPLRMAMAYTGAVMREAPEVDVNMSLGTLGRVLPAEGDGKGADSFAALVFNSIDKPVGGAGLYAWAQDVAMRVMATGHRWIVREAPRWETWWAQNRPGLERPEAPSEQDVFDGYRPYLVEYSPLQVPDWHFDASGTLQYVRIELEERVFRRDGATFQAAFEKVHLLFVRRGFGEFGTEFQGGGWWKFDKDRDPLRDPTTGEWVKGTFADPEIPAALAYYQRAKTRPGGRAVISRPGLTEIGQVAVSHMDLDSAADFDAIASGSRRIFIAGGSASQHAKVAEQLKANSRVVTIPGEGQQAPRIHDTGAVSASEAISKRQEAKRQQAALIAAEEAAWAPDSSAESKNVGFRDVKSPRLALFAEEFEAFMTAAIHLLERGFNPDSEPEGHVTFPRDFDLAPLVADILEAFDVLAASGAESPELTSRLVIGYLKQKGLLANLTAEDVKRIEGELKDSLEEKRAEAERGRDVARELLEGRGRTIPEPDLDPEPDPAE